MMRKELLILLVFISLAGCSVLDSDNDDDDGVERTYPPAFDYKTVTVQQMKTEIVPPDSLNTKVYVTAVIKCPEGAACFLPDGIIISDSLDAQLPESQIHLYAEKPNQFSEGHLYRMSLEITASPGNGEKRFRLLGYSE